MTKPEPRMTAVAIVAGAAGAMLLAKPRGIAARVADLLPRSATAGGAGTNFPGFETVMPTSLRGIGVCLLIVAALALAPAATSLIADRMLSQRWGRRATLTAGVSVTLLAGAIYAWYAHPPNMFPSNARIHWVDIYFDRADDYFYTLVKIHKVFYDVPFLLQALLGAANSALVYRIARSIWTTGWIPILLTLSFVGSWHMLLFANPAEDVHLSILPLLLCALAQVQRRPILFGVAAFLAFLARPPFALVIVAMGVAEVVAQLLDRSGGPRARRLIDAVLDRFLLRSVLTFSLLFIGWNFLLALLGHNWIVGDNPAGDMILSSEPIETDGFSISAFSGAYPLHLAWVAGPAIVLANLGVALSLPSLRVEARRLAILGWSFAVVNLILLEARPLLYFNVRYLAYLWPLLVISAWMVLEVRRISAAPVLAVGVAVMLAVTPIIGKRVDLDLRQWTVEHPFSALNQDRRELRRSLEELSVAVGAGRTGERNYVAYLLQRRAAAVRMLDPDDVPPGTVVFTSEPERFPGAETLHRSDGAFVLLMPHSGS